jgi:hypothetical protein
MTYMQETKEQLASLHLTMWQLSWHSNVSRCGQLDACFEQRMAVLCFKVLASCAQHMRRLYSEMLIYFWQDPDLTGLSLKAQVADASTQMLPITACAMRKD